MSTTLDLAQIESLLADTRKRGVYEPRIDEFVKSNELACDFSEFPEFKTMDAQSVRNSVRLNIEKKSKENEWPKLQVVLQKQGNGKDAPKHVILINLDVLAAAQAAQ